MSFLRHSFSIENILILHLSLDGLTFSKRFFVIPVLNVFSEPVIVIWWLYLFDVNGLLFMKPLIYLFMALLCNCFTMMNFRAVKCSVYGLHGGRLDTLSSTLMTLGMQRMQSVNWMVRVGGFRCWLCYLLFFMVLLSARVSFLFKIRLKVECPCPSAVCIHLKSNILGLLFPTCPRVLLLCSLQCVSDYSFQFVKKTRSSLRECNVEYDAWAGY